jgi:hypothetical protein
MWIVYRLVAGREFEQPTARHHSGRSPVLRASISVREHPTCDCSLQQTRHSGACPDQELQAYIVRKLGNLALTEDGAVKPSACTLLWIYSADQAPKEYVKTLTTLFTAQAAVAQQSLMATCIASRSIDAIRIVCSVTVYVSPATASERVFRSPLSCRTHRRSDRQPNPQDARTLRASDRR